MFVSVTAQKNSEFAETSVFKKHIIEEKTMLAMG